MFQLRFGGYSYIEKNGEGDFMKLLYAEDEVSMSEAVVDILTFHKYIVDAVYDGADALAYAESEQYDGIILDIMMPKMSGLGASKASCRGVQNADTSSYGKVRD